jgi:hypothetical protein
MVDGFGDCILKGQFFKRVDGVRGWMWGWMGVILLLGTE